MEANSETWNRGSRYILVSSQSQHLSLSPFHNETLSLGKNDIFSRCHPIISEIFHRDLGFQQFTPIQLACLPLLLTTPGIDRFSPLSSDVVISSPTGQGKTLCYVLPIVSSLFYRSAPRISAIILAPTRELVSQIAKIFSSFCSCPSATIESSSLKKSKYSKSQRQQASRQQSSNALSEITLKNPTLPHLRVSCLAGYAPFISEMDELCGRSPGHDKGPSDIIVATPGRFVEHCQTTNSIVIAAINSSKHQQSNNMEENGKNNDVERFQDELFRFVRWIVLDEADRLLEQNYQGWIEELSRVSKRCHTRPRKIIASATMTQSPEKLNLLELDRPLFFLTTEQEGSFSLPSELCQYWVVSPQLNAFNLTSSMVKPLALLYLLHQLYTPVMVQQVKEKDEAQPKRKRRKTGKPEKEDNHVNEQLHFNEEQDKRGYHRPRTVIFCGSKQTAETLTCLLDLHFGKDRKFPHIPPKQVQPIWLTSKAENECEIIGTTVELTACNFTSNLSKNERNRIVRIFEYPPPGTVPVDILVCSDVLARGLDISKLDVVINYDPPDTLRTYIHRVGRTARAGRSGTTFTLVSQQQLPNLARMLKSNRLAHENEMTLWDLVHKHKIARDQLKQWVLAIDEPLIVKSHPDRQEAQKTSYYQLLFSNLQKKLQTCVI